MIVDSSVWVGFLNGERTGEVAFLKSFMEARRPVWLLPVILKEVLQGADSEQRFARWSRALSSIPVVAVADPVAIARAAALLYARCRWRGVTPRSGNDCLIAATAVQAKMPILHRDQDFPRIATVEPRLGLIDPDQPVT